MSNPTHHRSEGTQSAKRILAGAPIAPQRTRAITTPRTSVQGLWAEGVPFRHLAELRRVEPATSTTPEPLLMRSEQPKGCATGTDCLHHPDCADTHCAGHPDNSADEQAFRQRQREQLHKLRQSQRQATSTAAEQAAFDLRGQDYSDHHGPRPMPGALSTRAKFWRCYLGGMALALAAGAWLIF
jgi:hypothetical protein